MATKVEPINLSELKNFSQITKGSKLKAPKMLLISNPGYFAKLLDEIEKSAKAESIKVTHEDKGDHYLLSFK